MSEIPSELVRAIQSGDCVLWAGAGFGTLAGRPGWNELSASLIEECKPEVREALEDLREQGRLRTVLSYVYRHHGDEPIVHLLRRVAQEGDAVPLVEGSARLANFPWRACFATTYADVIYRIFAGAGRPLDVLSHVDVHELSLRAQREPFILRTPPTGRSMRADQVFFEIVEEVVRTRTILFLGFDIDDPDFLQILSLLDRVGRGKRHFAWLPFVSDAEAEEILEQYGIETVRDAEETDLVRRLARLEEEMTKVAPLPSTAEGDLAALDLARALAGLDVRADLAIDVALTLDVQAIDALMVALPSASLSTADPRTLLRAGVVYWAHERLAEARRIFQQVVSRGAGREFEAIARFNLALVSAREGDGPSAVEGFRSAGESARTLALVPPRFDMIDVNAPSGMRLNLRCRDREGGEDLDIAVYVLGRAASEGERRRFYDEVQRLVELDHVAVQRVYGGFADGRLFGLLGQVTVGFRLSDMLSESDEPMSLAKAFEFMGPLMDGLEAAHTRKILHRNLHPQNIVLTPSGPALTGFCFPPVISYHRPSVVRANRGYIAPEVEAGAVPTAAADVYALAAVLYRCLTGVTPGAPTLAPSQVVADLDPRVDEVLFAAMSVDPAARPRPTELRTRIAGLLTTRRPDIATRETVPQPRESPEQAAPPATSLPSSSTPVIVPPAAPSTGEAPTEAPTSVIVPPSNPDDLEAWTWILERKPNHMEARAAIDRIEAQSRATGRWDLVAEILGVRTQLAQAQDQRIAFLRELASLFELELGAPGNALETFLALLDELSVSVQVDIASDVLRLGEVTGRWAEVAEAVAAVAERVVDGIAQASLYRRLARVYAEELSAPDRAISYYQKVARHEPEDVELLAALLALYRRTNRVAEVATSLLTIAELETGAIRNAHLLEAAGLLADPLGELEGALEAAELVCADDQGNDVALALAERLSRALERWASVARILVVRADAALDDVQASALRREAARLYAEKLGDVDAAIEQLRLLLERDRSDAGAARELVELLRPRVAEAPALRATLIDALYILADSLDTPAQRMPLLAECASLLDQEEDGGARASDCREQIVASLPADDPLVRGAAERLESWYEGQQAHHALAELLETRVRASALGRAERGACWRKLLGLRRAHFGDLQGQREALEALLDLDSGDPRWREELLELYLQTGEDSLAQELIAAQVESAQEPRAKAALWVHGARLELSRGDLEAAEASLHKAVELDPGAQRAWESLQELYERSSRPIKAVEAQIKAAETAPVPGERARRLYEAARTCIEVLGEPSRGIPLLQLVVELDPDHRDATELLLGQLVAAGEMTDAWPVAQALVTQVRMHGGDDRELDLRANLLAGRIALAVGERGKARDYFAAARGLDAANAQVNRALADLDLESGNFAGALSAFQSLALGGAAGLDSRAQAELYLQMGRAQKGLGELVKAEKMFERALDIDVDFEAAARALLDVHAETPGKLAGSKVRLAQILGAQAEALAAKGEGTPVDPLRDEQVGLLREAATIFAESLNRPGDAVDQLEAVLEIRPADPSVLHQMLELYSSAERWLDASRVLEQLADLQTSAATRAKYLYAGALIVRDHLDDRSLGERWMKRVLETDPLHEKAFRALVELYRAQGEWKDLSRILRDRLKSLTEQGEPEERVELLDQLGAIYDEHLDDAKTALAAYEQSLRLLPSDADLDQRVGRRRKVIALSLGLGAEGLAQAISHAQALIGDRPLEFDAYHQLVELYQRANRREAAAAVARALRFLKKATPEEVALAGGEDAGFVQARGTLTRELWRQCVYHPLENPRLSDLFTLIWHIVAAREGRTHAHYQIDREDRLKVSLQSSGVERFVAYACQVFDVPVPDFFAQRGTLGGITVAALADKTMVHPTLLVADAALAKQSDAMSIFRAARAVARVQPEHILASVLPSGSGLRNVVYGAVAVSHAGVAIPEANREMASSYAELIRRHLPPARLDGLKALTARVIEGGGADTKAWIQGVEYTVTRAGFVLTDSLETSARVLLQAEGGIVPGKDLIKDLVAYSVGEEYIRLRSTLKLGR